MNQPTTPAQDVSDQAIAAAFREYCYNFPSAQITVSHWVHNRARELQQAQVVGDLSRAPIAEGGGGPYKEGQWGVLRGGDKMEHYVSVTECVDELNRLTAAIESLSRQGGVSTDAESLRLHLGELTASEVRVAQAAIRYANSTRASEAGDWALVPREPTEAMANPFGQMGVRGFAACYAAMIAAAPAPGGGRHD